MNKTFTLYRLQQLDTQRLQRLKRIKQIDNILASDKAVQKCQRRIDVALKKHQANEAILEDYHLKIEEKTLKYKQTQAKLYGGKIHVTKELQDLQAESEALTRTIESLEAEQLEAIHQAEETENILNQAREQMKTLLGERATEHSLLLGEREKLLGQLPKINAQREAVQQQIPADMLEDYSRLFKSKSGIAVSEIFEESCKACGCELSPTDLQQASIPEVVMKCKGCGRILYKS